MRHHEGDDREAPEADARDERGGRRGRRRSDRRIGVTRTTYGPSRWLRVTQERIDAFARATEDAQWIHTNRQRAAEGPFGTTIAHGFLTLSLLPELWFEVFGDGGYHLTINYGVNRVRFTAPVPVDANVRATFRVEDVEPVDGGDQARIAATVEREGSPKPVCVAELVFRFLR